MAVQSRPNDWRDRKIREWLLLLLRFAVTREPSDRAAVLAMADEFDSLGMRWRPAAPSFFLRTSREVCAALIDGEGRHGETVLRTHAKRIEDPRLRRAFLAAAGISVTSKPIPHGAQGQSRGDVWKGLQEN